MKDRIYGCLYGGALGDSLGYPVEFSKEKYIIKNELLTPPYNISQFSDDTQMTLFTAEGLIAAGDKPNPVDYIASAYKYWYATQINKIPEYEFLYESSLVKDKRLHDLRAPGSTCLSALRTPDFKDVFNDSAGCGGVMRAAPIGLRYLPERAFKVGCESAALTHKNPRGYEPAGALASIVSLLICEESLLDAVTETIDMIKNKSTKDKLKEAIRLSNSPVPSNVAVSLIGEGWVGDEALGIAVYCALKFNKDKKPDTDKYMEGLLCSVCHSGDSDSTGAIWGNIVGTYWGMEAFPFNKKDIECFDIIDDICEKLYNL